MSSFNVSATSNVYNSMVHLPQYEASPTTCTARDLKENETMISHLSLYEASVPTGRAICTRENGDIASLLCDLKQRGIQVQETSRRNAPPEAVMHDRGAPIPAVVVSPQSEWGVAQTLKLLKHYGLYNQLPVSVKSGGHGYFNGASCSGVMVNLTGMTGRRIVGNTLFLEPGCVLGQTVNSLATHSKAVPHGDCFGVGAGGHFLTAGWDIILARRYGLGCQSVIGGRVVLWDGIVLDVDETTYPDLLYAMRGGAVAGVGVVTEIRLRLIDEPALVTWRFTPIDREQLAICVAHNAFTKAFDLPRDVSVSFRFYFERNQFQPVCSFNIVSLLSAQETIQCLNQHLGAEVTSFMTTDLSAWNEKSLIDLRMLPASEFLATNPEMLSEVSSTTLHENPLLYWKQTAALREMAASFLTSISHWVVQGCEPMLLEIYDAFQSVQEEPARERMYALLVQGGGQMLELQPDCSMPLGQALARFEMHWDDPDKEERWCRQFTNDISNIIRSEADEGPRRPYRGDIWLEEQATDENLDKIHKKYDRRFA